MTDPWVPTPQPYGAPIDATPALDREVQAALSVDAPWRFAAVAQPLLPVLVVVVLGTLLVVGDLPRGDTAGALFTLLASLLAGAGTFLVARNVAHAYGGWGTAFGFDLPRRGDRGPVLRWLGVQVLARLALLAALTAAFPGLADSEGGNVEGFADLPLAGLVTAGVAAVVVAPVCEELAFRGVLLRALMRRLGFWPAALVSSSLFAVLHAGGVSDIAALPLLVATILLFGLLQCVLVRRTGRLGPAIAVHSLMNLLVLILAASTG